MYPQSLTPRPRPPVSPTRPALRGLQERRRLGAAAFLALVAAMALPAVVAAHEVREVAGYQIVIGFIDEPVFAGQKSGLELRVSKDDQPVAGLEETLQAEVIKDDQRRDLPLSPRFGEEGAYQSYFFPTMAGPYTFHVSGTIEGMAIDESFTSSPDGFNEVEEVQAGQFPLQLPAAAEIAEDSRRGAEAAGQVAIAMALGAAGLVAGLVALGVALARRRSA